MDSSLPTPAVTVIMPAYNASRHIAEAIGSVQSQTFRDWELVVVDDCSSDDTLLKVREIAAADKRVKVYASVANAGNAFPVRREAVRLAAAPLIAPLDADDKIAPDYLERLMREKKASGAPVVYPTMYRMSDSSTPGDRLVPKAGFDYSSLWTGRSLVVKTLGKWEIGANGGVLDKEFYLDCMEKVEDDRLMNSDEYLTRIILLEAPAVKISEARYYYRDNPSSITQRVSLKPFDTLQTDIYLLKFTEREFGLSSEEYRRAALQQFCHTVDLMRYYNAHRRHFTKEGVRQAREGLVAAWTEIRWDAVKRFKGWKLRTIMRPGPGFAMKALRIFH